MRSILVLFAIAALGFVIILKKKDAPEVAKAPAKSAEVSQPNWMKRVSNGSRDVAQNDKQPRRENYVP
jgi:hypothetical protein